MLLRSKLQPRAISNLDTITRRNFPGSNVTRGYVISSLLNDYRKYIKDTVLLENAIKESNNKVTLSCPVNLTITSEANQNLLKLKAIIDSLTGRSLFPAEVIDVLLICAVNYTNASIDNDVPDKILAKCLLDYSYALLTEDILPVNYANARNGIIKTLSANNLL